MTVPGSSSSTSRGVALHTRRVSRLVAGRVLVALALLPAQGHGQGAPIPTDPNLKVAFIGDSGAGTAARRVLGLVKSEGAQLVVHLGDFDYGDNPKKFFALIDSVLGPDFPFLAAVGNHDVESWSDDCANRDGCYAAFLKARMARMGVTPDDPNLNDQMYAVTFRGLKLVSVGEIVGARSRFIRDQLATDPHVWKICGWHRNQRAMQVGGKRDEMGWSVYEICKDLGAIIATAHEHSYQRTRTLVSMREQVVDTSCADPNALCVAKGKSFVFVSGLGGKSVRDQERCLPATFPYGCKGEWAKIYTSAQGATYGALFIVFNVNGDPGKAQGYFKNIKGEVVDRFEVTADGRPVKPGGGRASSASRVQSGVDRR